MFQFASVAIKMEQDERGFYHPEVMKINVLVADYVLWNVL